MATQVYDSAMTTISSDVTVTRLHQLDGLLVIAVEILSSIDLEKDTHMILVNSLYTKT